MPNFDESTSTMPPAEKSGYARVNGVDLYYAVYGRGRPLIMLHGGFSLGDAFASVMPVIGAGRQVITVDLQGHGHTADVDRPLRWETMADDAAELIGLLGVPFEVDVANDPFFGRAGRMLANNQRDQKLKFELLIPVESAEKPTACLSFNYHQDHFGGLWGIQTSTGEVAHTACVGFGMERVALALFKHHGYDTQKWPDAVRKALWG